MRTLISSAVAATALAATPALAQDPHAHHHMEAAPAAPAAAPADPHAGHAMPMPAVDPHAGHVMPAAATGEGSRELGGPAWQPDVTPHDAIHGQVGGWMTMTHALINVVYDHQGGPRGDDKAFLAGMAMVSARRPVGGDGSLEVRAMLSPDPLMGKRGYPLLLTAGETADGKEELVDRQHPHDLFMELSATYTKRFGDSDRAFVYLGLPGAPAFGPPAFMHRLSAMDSPEAPISHHWLDSTHIVFGVATAGYVHKNLKLEVSSFKGQEPDQDRYDIERPKFDSYAARVSWNPTPEWALQASWAEAESPEILDPAKDARKWSASAIHTRRLGDDGWWSTTLAWGRRSADHGRQQDAFILESAVKPAKPWTVFARAERTETDELLEGAHGHGPTFEVAKASLGAIRDFEVAEHVKFGVGGLVSRNFIPAGLEASYGGDKSGVMGFVRLKVE